MIHKIHQTQEQITATQSMGSLQSVHKESMKSNLLLEEIRDKEIPREMDVTVTNPIEISNFPAFPEQEKLSGLLNEIKEEMKKLNPNVTVNTDLTKTEGLLEKLLAKDNDIQITLKLV